VQKVFHSINSRILLIPIIALIALIVAGLVSIQTIANVTLQEHQARARAVADASTKIVEYYEGKAARGEMTEQAAQEVAKEALRAIRYDGNEYVIARRVDGLIVVNGLFRNREGTPSLDNKDPNGTLFSADMIKAAQAGGGFNYYLWPKTPNMPPVRKATYSELTKGWKWVVGSGVYLDEVEAATWASAVNTAWMIGAMAVLTFALAFWLGRRITRPILKLTDVTHRLAEGDTAAAVPEVGRRDEIGTMAQAIDILKQRSAEATRLAADQDRFAAAGTLAVTASGITLMGVGSAFWGLCFGLLVLAAERVLRRDHHTCQYCGFQAQQLQEIINKADEYGSFYELRAAIKIKAYTPNERKKISKKIAKLKNWFSFFIHR